MLIYTIPPAMRYHAGVVISQRIHSLTAWSVIDSLDLSLEAEALARYIQKVFTRSLDSVITNRLLNLELDPNNYTDYAADRNGIIVSWPKLKGFIKNIEANPESSLDMVLISAYDESYDALVKDPGVWLTEIENALYEQAREAVNDLEGMMADVDTTMPDLIAFVEQHKIEYASFSNGLILFS